MGRMTFRKIGKKIIFWGYFPCIFYLARVKSFIGLLYQDVEHIRTHGGLGYILKMILSLHRDSVCLNIGHF